MSDKSFNQSEKNKNSPLSKYPALRKFDEIYKDTKANKKLNIPYKEPNVDREQCQINFDEFDKKFNLGKYSIKNANDDINVVLNRDYPEIVKKYDFTKITQDDLNYYLTLVKYYMTSLCGNNIFLKGVHNPIEKALDLLKSCKYNIRLALGKILFPVMDKFGSLNELEKSTSIIPQAMNNSEEMLNKDAEDKKEVKAFRSPTLYLCCALNSLIGADKIQKEKWNQYLIDRINNKIDLNSLLNLIEISTKMKMDIPEVIKAEMKRSEQISKKIKAKLSNKNESLDDLNDLYDIALTQKVQTNEFINLKDTIKKCKDWISNIDNYSNKCIEFSLLEELYKQGEDLPCKIENINYKNIQERYEGAKKWYDIYNDLIKSGKNKQSIKYSSNNAAENLQSLLSFAKEKYNFTSPEVISLETNIQKLIELENDIEKNIKQINNELNKEALNKYLEKYDEIKIYTSKYEEIEKQFFFIEWVDKKQEFIKASQESSNNSSNNNINKYQNEIDSDNKRIVLKSRQFIALIKEAQKNNLTEYKEVKEFIEYYNNLDNWIKKIQPIFFSVNSKNKDAKTILNQINNSKYKLEYSVFYNYFLEGKILTLISEEFEALFSKCKDIVNLYNDIKKNEDFETIDFNKLKLYRDKISLYNIICPEFEKLLLQLNNEEKWTENAKNLCNILLEKKNKLSGYDKCDKSTIISKKKNLPKDDCNPFDKRKNNIKVMEILLNENKFYEDLIKLINNVPSNLRNTHIHNDLKNYQIYFSSTTAVELKKDFENSNKIFEFIQEESNSLLDKKLFENLLSQYKILSLKEIINDKIYIENIKEICEEFENIKQTKDYLDGKIKISQNEINNLHAKERVVNNWLDEITLIFKEKKISYNDISKKIKEFGDLPLKSKKIDKIFDYVYNLNSIQEGIKNNKELPFDGLYEGISIFYNNLEGKIITDNKYIDIFYNLYKASSKWAELAKIIIDCREFCQLYFKNKNNILLNNNNDKNNCMEIEIENKNNDLTINNSSNKKNNLNKKINKVNNKNYKKILTNIFDEFKYQSPKEVQKFYLNHPLKTYECENLLSLLNTNKSENEEVIDKEQFMNFKYIHRYECLDKHLILIEDNNEKYCICRQGDDSVNYMIACENCGEWFHGKCLDMTKDFADSIKQYSCLFCSRRYNLPIEPYHKKFYDLKRISLENLIYFINEGKSLNVSFWELYILEDLKVKCENWLKKFNKLVEYIIIYYNNNDFLSNEYIKILSDLYLESEGIQIDIPNHLEIINIAKHSDWMHKAITEIKANKLNEKNIKDLIKEYYYNFNINSFTSFNEPILMQYYEKILNKSKLYLDKLIKNVSENVNSISNLVNPLLSNFLKKKIK